MHFPTLSLRELRRRAAWIALTFVLVYALEAVALHFMLPGTWVALVWPASGAGAAMSILLGPWVAVGVFAADLLFESMLLGSLPQALPVATGNALQVAAIGWLVRRHMGGRDALRTPGGVVRYALVAGLLLTLIASVIGVAGLWLHGAVESGMVGVTWLSWWLTDAVSLLLIAPIILVWACRDLPTPVLGREAFALGVATLATAALMTMHLGGLDLLPAMLSMPFACWAAFRFGAKATVVVMPVLAMGALAHVALHADPNGGAVMEFIQIQAFLALSAALGLIVGAYVAQERARLRAAAEKEFQAVNDARNRLLSTFAHELNNPLTPMRLQLDLLTSGHIGPVSEKQAASLAMVHRNTLRLSKLVSDLRDVGLLQSGRPLRVRKERIDLVTLARDAVESYQPMATAAGVHVEFHAPSAAAAVGDHDRMVQVVGNLLGNAIKYSRRGGRIRVRVMDEDAHAVVAVEDEGVGLTQEQISRMFTPFSQVQEPDRQREGTGLGLYIARGIVDGLDGRLWCESAGPGRGASFLVRLAAPRTEPPAPPAPAPFAGAPEVSA